MVVAPVESKENYCEESVEISVGMMKKPEVK